jgi:hypothetical protein
MSVSEEYTKIGFVYVVYWMYVVDSHPVIGSEAVYSLQHSYLLYTTSLTLTGCESTTHIQQTT